MNHHKSGTVELETKRSKKCRDGITHASPTLEVAKHSPRNTVETLPALRASCPLGSHGAPNGIRHGEADPQHCIDHCEMCIYLDARLRAFAAETIF